jgi:cytochrome c551/c552
MSRRCRVIAVLGGLALVALAAGPASAGHDALSVLLPASPLEGSRLFAEKGCLGCHGVHGVGGSAGPDLGRGLLNRPLLEIAAVMWNHSPGMEHLFQERGLRRPTFEPKEMAALLAFLYYLGSLDPPGDASRGAALFKQKGCQSCHAVGGGPGIGPDLGPYGRYASPLFLTAALWNRGRAMAAAMEARKAPRAVFEGTDIPDVVAYVRAAAGGSERIYARPGSPKRGEALFTEKGCVRCHAVRGHGGKVGPDLAVVLRGSLTQIAGAMWNHGPTMWTAMAARGIAVPVLGTDELADLVSYLYFFQFIDAPGDARRGRAVYAEKRCGSCHETAGPVAVAPPLTDVAATLGTPVGLMTAMWNHAGRMTEMMAEQNVAWPVLKGTEMADLIAYLRGPRGGPGGAAGAAGTAAPQTTGRPATGTRKGGR